MYLKDRLWEHIADVEVDVEYNPDPSADHEGVEEPKQVLRRENIS